MIGLYAGLRREEILALQWDCVFLDGDTPYISVRRAWHAEHNKPVILDELKTKAARREIPIPDCLAECLREAKANSKSDFVVANRDGGPLTYTQFVRYGSISRLVLLKSEPMSVTLTVRELSIRLSQFLARRLRITIPLFIRWTFRLHRISSDIRISQI